MPRTQTGFAWSRFAAASEARTSTTHPSAGFAMSRARNGAKRSSDRRTCSGSTSAPYAAQRAAELVRGEFVEDPEALVIVLRARDERIDLRPGIDVRVGIGAGRGLEHEFLPTVLGRGRTERRHPDPDDPDAHVRPSPAGPFAGNPRPHKRLSHAPCSQRP